MSQQLVGVGLGDLVCKVLGALEEDLMEKTGSVEMCYTLVVERRNSLVGLVLQLLRRMEGLDLCILAAMQLQDV